MDGGEGVCILLLALWCVCVLSAEDVTLISHPILKKNHSYIVFGEAKIEDLNSQAQAQAAEQFRNAPQVCLQIFEKRAEM